MNQKKNRNSLILKDKTPGWNIKVRVLFQEETIDRKLKFGTKIWNFKVILN